MHFHDKRPLVAAILAFCAGAPAYADTVLAPRQRHRQGLRRGRY